MTSINFKLEDNMKSNDDSLSMAPYNNFNSLTAEDSVEQIRKRNIDTHSQTTESIKPESRDWMSSEYCYKLIGVVAVVAIIAVLWMIMALPTVFYIHHTITTKVQENQTAPEYNTNNRSSNTTICQHADFDKNETTCKQHLQQCAKCLEVPDSMNTTLEVYVSTPFQESLSKAKDAIRYLLQAQVFTGISIRPQCLSRLEPFLCLHFIHLCDNGMDIGPSVQQCRNVSKVCDDELKQVKKKFPNYRVDRYLSNCAPKSPFDNCRCITSDTNRTYNCREGFYQNLTENGRCEPECNVWSPYHKGIVLITDILNIFAAVICVISGGAVLVLSWIRREKLYHYPSIFIIYQTVSAVLLSILVLIGASARRRLFCRSRSLLESVRKPTVFCFITGIALYYIVLQLLLWWLWHTVAVFWGTMWPLHARKFNRSRNARYLHIMFILAGLILPAIPVIIVIFASTIRGGFTITRAPPILCAGYGLHTNFWGFMFPLNILLAVGVTLMVFILRTVIKNHYLSRIHKITVNLNWAVETKVIIVLCYYIVLGAAVLSIFTYALVKINVKKLIDYFSCEARGQLPLPITNTSECQHLLNTIQSTDNPISISLAIVILGFLPVVNLVYVIKFSELKNKIKTYSETRYVHYVQKEANKSAASHYIPYKEHRDTNLQCESVTIPDNNLHTEPLLTSQMNNDLRR